MFCDRLWISAKLYTLSIYSSNTTELPQRGVGRNKQLVMQISLKKKFDVMNISTSTEPVI